MQNINLKNLTTTEIEIEELNLSDNSKGYLQDLSEQEEANIYGGRWKYDPIYGQRWVPLPLFDRMF